ncbi:MAG: LysM peptidoglycan-binding domain-containing protein [Pseudomonadota bacterium]
MIAIKQKTSTVIRRIAGKNLSSRVLSALVGMLLTLSTIQAQDNPVLAPGYPERYTVVEGDTLWDISGKFLRDPWRWPEVWQGNPQVENPDLIYPGDVLVMTFIDGRPTLKSLRRETVKLSPSARVEDYADAIPPVDPRAIQAYISAPLVTDDNEMSTAGYIVDGTNNHLLMGKYDQFYARGIEDQEADEYRVFRPGRHFVDPISEESLGYEAKHIGDARMLRQGDTARLALLNSYQDAAIRDRLRPIYNKESVPFFFPKAPDNPDLRGVILETENTATALGPLSVVTLNLGDREGVKQGDVFRIKSQSVEKEDPVTGEKYRIPEEKIGLLMVFRTFNKVSYALITNSNRPIHSFDVVVSPDKDDA